MNEGQEETKRPDQRQRIELAFVVLYFVGRHFLTALTYPIWSAPRAGTPYLHSLYTTLVGALADWTVVLYFLYSTKKSWSDIGFKGVRPVLGIWIVVCALAIKQLTPLLLTRPLAHIAVSNHLLPNAWLESISSSSVAGTWPELCLGLLMMVQVGFKEEVVYRGLVTTGLLDYCKSPWVGCTLSALAFTSIHVYQGLLHMPSQFVWAFFAAFVYWKTRSIWPLIIAHALIDGSLLLQRSLPHLSI